MKAIVIYNSQTGFTKKYAEWISAETGCECVDLKSARKIRLSEYDALVFGSWCRAGSPVNFGWFRKNLLPLSRDGKKICIYTCGGTPFSKGEYSMDYGKFLSKNELDSVKAFYCPGGMNFEKMNLFSKLVMKLLKKALSSKKNPTKEESAMLEMIGESYDVSSKKYAEPIIAELKSI